jgi:hypothetical protein
VVQEGDPQPSWPRVEDVPTPYAGLNRIRFEGLRKPALSAPRGAPLSLCPHPTPPGGWEDGLVLRMMRGPDGGPSKAVRLLTLLVVVAVLGGSAAALTPVLGWLLDLL